MPSLGDMNLVAVHGTLEDFQGNPYTGSITFMPSTVVDDPGSDLILVPKIIPVTLDGSGHFTQNLPATDDPDGAQIDWYYTVTFSIGPGSPAPAQISVPVAFAGTGVSLALLLATSVIGPTSNNYLLMPTGAPTIGEVVTVTGTSPLTTDWGASPLIAAESYTDAAVVGLQPLLTFVYVGPWATATAYLEGQFSLAEGSIQFCTANHTSGTFDTDKAAGFWITTGIDASSALVLPYPTAVKTGAYNAAVGDFVWCDSSGGAFTVTLPTAPADGSWVGVGINDATDPVNAVTVSRGGSDVFNKTGGSTTETLKSANQKMWFNYQASTHVWTVYDFASIDGIAALVQTLSNKRITKRVLALSANSATPAVNTDNYDVVHITGQSTTITGFTMTGTPVDGDTLRVSITGTGSVTISGWGSSFESSGNVSLPATTLSTTRLDIGFVWNSETSKWRCAGVA